MKSLSSLSKYLGLCETWSKMIKQYQLQWSKHNKSLNVFHSIFNDNQESLPSMIAWLKSSISHLSGDYGNTLLFATLTGLRPEESLNAIGLIKNQYNEYVDYKRNLLLHYKYPNLFLRRTKNAYVSVIDQNILETAKDTPKEFSYNVPRLALKKPGLNVNLYYCRKVFATYLRNKGIEPEIIDLLQGRISSSVFVNHYYRPDINEIITNRIRPVLIELLNNLRN